jgi:hypothetical protein
MRKHFSPVVTIALVFLLCVPVGAQNPPAAPPIGGVSKAEIIGIVVGVAAFVAVVSVLLIGRSARGRTITGCIIAADNGMTVADEKDKHVYVLSGNTAGVKAGERMKLQGHKINANAGNPLGWGVSHIQKDYGACRP